MQNRISDVSLTYQNTQTMKSNIKKYITLTERFSRIEEEAEKLIGPKYNPMKRDALRIKSKEVMRRINEIYMTDEDYRAVDEYYNI